MSSHIFTRSIATALLACWLAVPANAEPLINWDSLEAAVWEDDSSRQDKHLPSIEDPQVKRALYIEPQTRPRTPIAAKIEAKFKAHADAASTDKPAAQAARTLVAEVPTDGKLTTKLADVNSARISPASKQGASTPAQRTETVQAKPSLIGQIAHWRASAAPQNPMSPAAHEVHVGDDLQVGQLQSARFDTAGYNSGGSSGSDCCSADGCCGECDSGPSLSFSVDALYWKVRRRGLDVAIENPTATTTTIDGPIRSIGLNWDTGARASFRYTGPRGWDVTSTYTFFETDNREMFNAPAGTNLQATRTSSTALSLFETAAVQADFDYEVFDIEMGRWYSPTCDLSIRPFFGARGGEITQELRISYDRVSPTTAQVLVAQQTRVDFYGLRCGSEFHWHVRDCVSLFGRGAASVLVGDYSAFHGETQNPLIAGNNFAVTDDYTQLLPVLETALGVEMRRGSLTFQAGYDAAIWFNASERVSFTPNVTTSNFSQLTNVSNHLGLDGAFARVIYTR
jgi:hypothetical protein